MTAGSLAGAVDPVDPEDDPFVPSRIKSTNPHHQPRLLTVSQREVFRQTAVQSRLAKLAALSGTVVPLHAVNVPKLDPYSLMPSKRRNGHRALSLFSGGGGLDLAFDRAGFGHAASYEILEAAAETLRAARPKWDIRGGEQGDVRGVKWSSMRGEVDVIHGGPPCQPFSIAGRQQGSEDIRDMWPEFVRSVRSIRPRAFIAENVSALASKKFETYVQSNIIGALDDWYHIRMLTLRAEQFGVPQLRRRVFFVGFARKRDAERFVPPAATHYWKIKPEGTKLKPTMGLREALGLPDIGIDAPSPTVRSTLSGPRHTTSILNSVAAQRVFESIQIWPNGVAPTREDARTFVTKNGHFRLSVPDVALMQGFPEDWPLAGATYMKLGQLGNAVPPPLGYAVALSVSKALDA
ncbi:DNA (cytosine-5-)-methyltransferase [Rhodococcus fascians]|nr:DNA (cytosine-5-)-methyltransferase [Rhodococcus fascians]MBY4060465.1 DNA (cytosine-5-)-methyltransferase [Rhodococcus fascians]MBY4069451.1 DNA (cytosine-5-)-methyltransferase [Rhodococcus fascians]MBY4403788.1 DNA (cytosine-5-)-methyltransferase [Rhodococcus fascians]MBY4419105.1 DNA (cytosine-5-)-methyltransferase [Rhodococcus fascians]